MKCGKCNGEWTPPPGKSVTVCPFCDEPLASSTPDALSNNVIKTLVSRYGEGVLRESKLISLVADELRNDAPKTLKRIRMAISDNVPHNLLKLKSVDEQERTRRMIIIAAALKDDYDMGLEAAYEIVNWFAEALGFKTLVAPPSAKSTSVAIPSIQTPPPIQGAGITITPKIGSIMPFGGYNWLVLDVQNGRALVLSEKIIEKMAYHHSWEDTTWEKCKLRSDLNGVAFYNDFDSQDKARIAETTIKTYKNPWYGMTNNNPLYGKKDYIETTDKIFLLSIEEVVRYFGDSGQLKNKNPKSEYYIDDKYNSARIAKDTNGEASWWWLRSPGGVSSLAAYVNDVGTLEVGGSVVDDDDGGVRPALWLDLDCGFSETISDLDRILSGV